MSWRLTNAALAMLLASAGAGAAAEAPLQICDVTDQCALALKWTVDGEFKKDKDLSGLACATPTACIMVSDEEDKAQLFTLDSDNHVLRTGERVKLPVDGGEEIDAEAVAYADGAYVIVGSHGAKRHSDGTLDLASFNIYRLPVDPASGKIELARIERASLRDAIRNAESPLRDFAEQPLPQGANIEGIAIERDVIYAGFRAPSKEAQAFVLPVEQVFGGTPTPGPLLPLPLGAETGIRDMAAVPGGWVVLAGPVDQDGDFSLYAWQGGSAVTRLGSLRNPPQRIKDGEVRVGKAEGLLYLGTTDTTDAQSWRFLVIFDDAEQGAPYEVWVPAPG